MAANSNNQQKLNPQLNIEAWNINDKEIKEYTIRSKTERRKLSVNIDELYEKDRLFNVWKEYFEKYY